MYINKEHKNKNNGYQTINVADQQCEIFRIVIISVTESQTRVVFHLSKLRMAVSISKDNIDETSLIVMTNQVLSEIK